MRASALSTAKISTDAARPPQRRLSQRDDPKVRAGPNAPQEEGSGGDKQRLADCCLQCSLKPRRHVHPVSPK